MKKLSFGFCSLLLLLCSCSVQKNNTQIDQKPDSRPGKEIVLVKVLDDSRCPERVQCIWAGEVTFAVAAYEDLKMVEQVQFTLNQNTHKEINDWFMKHLPAGSKDLKEISVLPYPKEGVAVKPEDYYIQLIY
ncbi:hypothetical protein [Flavobacterium humi]|uniref:Uncharacterized protein n=1 Tax=Flavobacterium humi TaxID=2562683 RepID=A0A4Z0L5K5_9FLAO|nr:hypothetical protein [Flavobacterium humi]TGD57538.1 hypothetical protein E4635_10115 [Flavobacterium humi]